MKGGCGAVSRSRVEGVRLEDCAALNKARTTKTENLDRPMEKMID